MGQTVFLADNLFNGRIYPLHSVTAEEEPAGFEAWRVASGRREGTSYATASTANSDWWLKVVADRLRTADMVVLDRGHNLAGKTVRLECSLDDFTTTDTIFDGVLPADPASAPLDNFYGVRTEEGAWALRFPPRAATAWRLYVPAMGTGLVPRIIGLWIGLSYGTNSLTRPVAPNAHRLVGEVDESEVGWLGFGRRVPRREGALRLELPSVGEYEVARYYLEGLYGRGRPTWVTLDADDGSDTFLAIAPPSAQIGFVREPRWFYPRIELPFIEHEPLED